MGILTEFVRWLPGYFFPKICYGCEKEGSWVCDDCRKTVERVLDSPVCPECLQPAAFGATHPGCRRKWGLDGLISFYKYAGWAREIVREAKFGKHHRFAGMKELAGEMATAIRCLDALIRNSETIDDRKIEGSSRRSKVEDGKSIFHSLSSTTILYHPLSTVYSKNLSGAWVVVPVPLHWWRRFKRGFNQAELIADELAEIWGLPIEKLLIRRQYTQPQTLTEKEVKLTKKQEEKLGEKYKSSLQRDEARKRLLNKLKAKRRRENIKGAFEINSEFTRLPARQRIQNSELVSVLLVDDVWTSGATMKECCGILKKAGVKKVWGVTLMRT